MTQMTQPTTLRTDLLALTPQTLASLANRGLVKRAEKDVKAGSGPEVTVTDDGTVRGRFPDGTDTALPPGLGLDTADCGCAATGVCRHRIGLVLAYQRTHQRTAESAPADDSPAAEAEFVDWTPAEFDDDALTAALGRAALSAAQRVKDRGYVARLHRPTAAAPEPRVELPTCTVRFPVPHELGYALTDASAALRGEVVVLAVWAFRAADGTDGATTAAGAATPAATAPTHAPAPTPAPAPAPTATPNTPRTTEVSVGGRTPTATAHLTDGPLRTALGLADDLLLDGVQQAGPVFAGSLARAQEALTGALLHWPAGAVAELREQVHAYATRGTHYEAERFALLLAELHARHRAAGHDPVGALGTKEAPQTPLRRVRLVALGCRIGGTARDRTAETYFAHAEAGIALVLRKRWELTEDQSLSGHELAGRRLLGSPLRTLATANVVSEHTSRAADRTVSISRGRIAATSVTPLGSAWRELPGSLLLRDTAAHLRAAGERPPRLIRPRVQAESVRVVEVAAVESVGYDPAAQRLEAVVRDPAGNEILVRAAYNPLCPGGLDALAAALGDEEVHGVSGMLNRAHGRIVLDPLAVLTGKGVIIPDLAPGEGDTALAMARARPTDPITTALESALTALAQAPHHGLRRLTAPARTRLTDSAAALQRAGLHSAARLIRDLVTVLHRDGATAAVPAWVDAQIQLAVSLELHAEGAQGLDTAGNPDG
ncbi:hypothetical protein OG331_18850 [Streptomyces sp. NBC_01017]|uniref:hypothetical protein n=1 Tax=Streptomyces sp. NBC_01017 TaxID=2903721 RepID=UPI00386E5938|nr:hypothetical protein OG331_18850 [Streptomyces sp. NBC_01017]